MKFNSHIKLKKNNWRIFIQLAFSEKEKLTLKGKGENPEISSAKARLLVKGLNKFDDHTIS